MGVLGALFFVDEGVKELQILSFNYIIIIYKMAKIINLTQFATQYLN